MHLKIATKEVDDVKHQLVGTSGSVGTGVGVLVGLSGFSSVPNSAKSM